MPDCFWVLFAGEDHWKLLVKGHRLRPLFDAISEHRLRLITRIDRDMGHDDGKKPVVTSLEIFYVERKKED